ncbi:MAG TPA: hypothetical protein VKU82_08870 [Planctomycetaceae bacterium]|nr:hypothetical protein [Planctomycetaceae bacterium]
MKYAACLLFSMSAFALVGCGEEGPVKLKTVPVKGTLFVDGAPTGDCTISFTPTGPADTDQKKPTKHTAGATVAKDGTFTLKTYEDGDGAVPGKYEVSIASDMSKMQMTPTKPTKTYTVEIASTSDGKPQDLKIELESTGAEGNLTGTSSEAMNKKGP